MFYYCLCLILTLVAVSLPSGEPYPVAGAVQQFSYEIYKPSNYSPDRKWPILYCFDPGGRGSVPVERFKSAAEKYGYIVVGSNDSRNGPGVDLSAIIKAMWLDTHAKCSIDDRRVYAAGFSGGARVAIAFAYSNPGAVAGVIAAGAGFPSGIVPDRSMPFALFATTGADDFNYIEVFDLAAKLDKLGLPVRLETFDGGHDWPPERLTDEALRWMEIQAMKSGRRPKDAAFITESLGRLASRAREHEQTDPYDAYQCYRWLAHDYQGLADVTELQKKAAQLGLSPAVKQRVKLEREMASRQQTRAKSLDLLKMEILAPRLSSGKDGVVEPRPTGPQGSGNQDALGTLGMSPDEQRKEARADLHKSLADLRRSSSSEKASPERTLAKRVLTGFLVECVEEAATVQASKKFELAAGDLEIALEIRPESAGIAYSLAGAYSMAGQKQKAIDALKKAVSNGFADSQAIRANADFDPIRSEPQYLQLVEGLSRK